MGMIRRVHLALGAVATLAVCAVAPAAAATRTATIRARQAAAASAVTANAAAGGGSLITPSTDAGALAEAMSSQPGLVTGASWPALDSGAANPSADNAAGVATGPGVGKLLPTDGSSFAVLTTGDVTLADPPNDSPSAGANNGTTWRNVNDPTQLEVDVNVASGATCLALDGAFYSEEYPEYVGSAYNDGFIAELDQSTWSYDPTSNTYAAPDNFAFDEQHHLITVNSVNFQSDQSDTGLQYDGSTKLLTMTTPVTPGAHTLYFSIFDAGDHVFDSAMFLDNLRTYTSADCAAGAAVADADGDGIPDSWELHGVTIDGHFIDLPAMGADPNHKDVFVQVNAMDGLRPSNGAMHAIQTAFDNAPVANPDGTTGIHLHIDNGPSSVMNPVTGQAWGPLSQAENFPEQDMLGPGGDPNPWPWAQAVDPIKNQTFAPTGREPIFHLALAIGQFNGTITHTKQGTFWSGNTGLSRSTSAAMASSDFMVAMHPLCGANIAHCPQGEVAGTFMHELGHNLGLHHGGQDDLNDKPNYPSVMNYLFSFSLVPGPNSLDYSRIGAPDMPTLDESNLDENVGIGAPSASPFASSFTYLPLCNGVFGILMSGPVDYNCNGASTDTGVQANLNPELPSRGGDTNSTDIMVPYDDWNNLQFKGGAIGGQGLAALLPDAAPDDEAPADQLQALANQVTPPPSVSTGPAANVTATAATVTATANPDGSDAQLFFQYDTTGDYDQASDTTPVDIGAGNSSARSSTALTSLAPATTYHYRAVVTTNTDQEFGADQTFTTPPVSHPQPKTPPAALAAVWKLVGRPRLDARGRLLVTLRCLKAAACRGPVTVTVTIKARHGRHKTRTLARVVVSLPAGHSRTVTLTLRAADARALRHGTRLVIQATPGAGSRTIKYAGRATILKGKARRH
jgi:hypothetical protein